MPISLHSDSVYLWYFKIRLFDITEYLRSTNNLGFSNKGIRKSEFVAKSIVKRNSQVFFLGSKQLRRFLFKKLCRT